MKQKPEFQNHKNCLEASQTDNEINYLEENKINVNNLSFYKRKDQNS